MEAGSLAELLLGEIGLAAERLHRDPQVDQRRRGSRRRLVAAGS